MFRWISGISFFLLGGVFWLGTMIADPFTSWGIEHERIRPSVAEIGINLAALAIAAFLASAAVIFTKASNRKGRLAVALALLMLFFTGTAIARLIWVKVYVLGGYVSRNLDG